MALVLPLAITTDYLPPLVLPSRIGRGPPIELSSSEESGTIGVADFLPLLVREPISASSCYLKWDLPATEFLPSTVWLGAIGTGPFTEPLSAESSIYSADWKSSSLPLLTEEDLRLTLLLLLLFSTGCLCEIFYTSYAVWNFLREFTSSSLSLSSDISLFSWESWTSSIFS
jgi:hypothetical protein